jgi:hypothetical protein
VTVGNGGLLKVPFLTADRVSNLDGGPAAAQASVAKPSIPSATITANTVAADFPQSP